MNFMKTSKNGSYKEEPMGFFRKLKHLDAKQINKNDENLRKLIQSYDFDQSQSSVLTDEMDAMEKTLKLTTLRDELSDNIVDRINDPKEKILIALLYKVCNDMDPTRMTFIKFTILLKNHGILNNINFLNDNTRTSHNHSKLNNNASANSSIYSLNKLNYNDYDADPDPDPDPDNDYQEWTENDDDDDDNDDGDDDNNNVDDDDNDQSFAIQIDNDDDDVDDADDGSILDNNFFDDIGDDHIQFDDDNDKKPIIKQNNDLQLSRLFSNNSMRNSNHYNHNTIALSPTTTISSDLNPMSSRYCHDFIEIESIGYGGFGVVYRVQHKLDSKEYAIKKIIYKHNTHNHNEKKNEIIHEVTSLATLQHQNIVRYYNAWIEPLKSTKIKIKDKYKRIHNTNKDDLATPMSYLGDIDDQDADEKELNPFLNTPSVNPYNTPSSYHLNNLKPTGVIPIVRNSSIEDKRALLTYTDAQKSFISPYQQHHPHHPVNKLTPLNSTKKLINFNDININSNQNDNDIDIRAIYAHWNDDYEYYSCLFLQTEYCGKYTLRDFINESSRVPNREYNMVFFAQILMGLAQIHSKLLLHRDLKPENIFLVTEGTSNEITIPEKITVKIGDFGLSKNIQNTLINNNNNISAFQHASSSDLTTNTGTEIYSSPEQLNASDNNNTYGTASDMYSLGIILFELIQKPFTTMMERRISINKFRQNGENGIDKNRIDTVKFAEEVKLMLSLTNKDPNKRPTAHYCVKQRFITPFWMKKVIYSAVPNLPPVPSFAPTPQKSLEYQPSDDGDDHTPTKPHFNDIDNDLNPVRVWSLEQFTDKDIDDHNKSNKSSSNSPSSSKSNNNIHQATQSPYYYVVQSPGTPPNGLSLDAIATNNNNNNNCINVNVVSPLCQSKMHQNKNLFSDDDIDPDVDDNTIKNISSIQIN